MCYRQIKLCQAITKEIKKLELVIVSIILDFKVITTITYYYHQIAKKKCFVI